MYEKNGEKRYATEIQATEVKFLSSPKADNNNNSNRNFPKKQAESKPSYPDIDDIPF
jgi:single-stranded DNA-binding protein